MDRIAVEQADRELFDRIAQTYVNKDLKDCCRVARELRLRQTLKTAGPVQHVLEVGCGAGFSARYLEGEYETYTGVDYSQELIRYAEHYNAAPHRQFVCSNIKDFAADRKYDAILMVGVLHHMTDPSEVLAQLGRLLAKDGRLVVNEPQRGNPVISASRWIRKRVDKNYSADQVEFSERELRELFDRAGYDAESWPQGFFSTPFAETQPGPEWLALSLCTLASKLDPALERWIGDSPVRHLAWNAVVVGRLR